MTMRGVILAFVALSATSLVARAAEPPLILFSSQGKTGVVAADGSGLRYLDFRVPGEATCQASEVFPDGRRVILLSMAPRRDGPGKSFDEYYTQTPTRLWIYDLASNSLEEICRRDRLAPFTTPALLVGPDRLLVQVVKDRVGQIHSVRLDGSDPQAFTQAGEGLPYGLSLSADGKRVAFHLASPRGYEVWVSDPDGKNRVRLAGHPDHLYFGTSFSPDRQWVLYVDCHYHTDHGHDWADVCVGRVDGSEHRVLTKDQAMWFAASYGNKDTRGGGSNLPSWTPEGKILFPRKLPGSKVAWRYRVGQSDVDHFNREYLPDESRGGTEVCLLDPRDGSMVSLTKPGERVWDFRASLSPDGGRLVFCRAKVGEAPAIWTAEADGSKPRPLTRGVDEKGADHPRWAAARPPRR